MSDGLNLRPVTELLEIHDRAGRLQQELLEQYPGGPEALPLPLREDLRYFDGAQFFMLHITESLEEAGIESVLTEEQHLLLSSTNGLNDWWMDESGWEEHGERDYGPVLDTYDGINAVCYSYLSSVDTEKVPAPIANPDPTDEVKRVTEYYDYVLSQMPPEHQPAIAKFLMSINLYQGVTLFQEEGFRDYLRPDGPDLDNNNIDDEDLAMLKDMQLEKGGFMLMYFWPYIPEISDGIELPAESMKIVPTIKRFLRGTTLYADNQIGRRLLSAGGILQRMDDACDRDVDWDRGVVSPENYQYAYSERTQESWGELVGRILGELTALKNQDKSEGFKVAISAAASAVAGLTRYRAFVYGQTET